MLGLIGGIWGRLATVMVGVAGLVAALFSWRHSIRKSQRQAIENEQQRRTIERLKIKAQVGADVRGMSDDDILDKLRDQGFIRD